MRESIGSTWIFQIVVIFILLFVGFLFLTLTYSKSYKLKNEVINIIEKNGSVNKKSVALINNYLTNSGYSYKYRCPQQTAETINDPVWYGCNDLEGNTLVEVTNNSKDYYYCIRKFTNKDNEAGSYGSPANKNITMYYEIQIFYKFSLPIIENIGTFTTNGTTNDMFIRKDIFDKNV